MAEKDLAAWLTLLDTRLAAGDGAIDCDTDSAFCRITVQWDDIVSQIYGDTQQFSVGTEL